MYNWPYSLINNHPGKYKITNSKYQQPREANTLLEIKQHHSLHSSFVNIFSKFTIEERKGCKIIYTFYQIGNLLKWIIESNKFKVMRYNLINRLEIS